MLSHAREKEEARHLARALGMPFVDLDEYAVSCGLLAKLPAELSCRVRCVPMVFNSRRVVLVVDDPFRGAYLLANPELLGPPYDRSIELALTTRRGLDTALHKRVVIVRG